MRLGPSGSSFVRIPGPLFYDAPRRCWWVSSSKARKFSHEFSSVARNA